MLSVTMFSVLINTDQSYFIHPRVNTLTSFEHDHMKICLNTCFEIIDMYMYIH